MSKLDKEAKELRDSFERGEWISDKNLYKRKSELKEYARVIIRKDKRVNIRISERDLKELQRIAVNGV